MACVYELLDEVTVLPITAYEPDEQYRMTTRKSQRHYLKLTPEQQATIDEVRRTIETEKKAEIMALAKRLRNAKRRGMATLEKTLQMLKHERESQGVSLAVMEERTGMAKSNLSKLENAADSNPTVATLLA
ncbi:MAG: helix-turn-helix transcriptional regulator [Planctomycetes bacterium]|nr:helix-turn-helix transcriptional regulator [Planctomycetota bacterium]